MTALSRRAALFLPLVAAGCGGGGEIAERTNFPPLTFGHLTPLPLNVSALEIAPLPPPDSLAALDPAPPGPALVRMANDRLTTVGTLGSARFTVETASLQRRAGGIDGAMAVRLDVMTSDGTRSAFAQAQVSRRSEGVGSDLRAALYDITVQMMADMNVEFEYQVRRSLRDWLQDATPAPPPPAVEAQPLAPTGRPTPRPAP